MQLRTALERLLSECDGRRQRDVWTACQRALDQLSVDEEKARLRDGRPSKPSTTTTAATATTTTTTATATTTNATSVAASLFKVLTGGHASTNANTTSSASANKTLDDEATAEDLAIDGDSYWAPFRLACHHANPPKLREAALDLLHKLLAHKVIRGAAILPDDSTATSNTASNTMPNATSTAEEEKKAPVASYPPLLIDDIVHTACMASPLLAPNDNGNNPEAAVHLQIIKVLLTAVTASSCEVHEASLLKSLQACFNIYLHSKNLVNQTTAKAGLTQMCHFVFSQLEKYSVKKSVSVATSTKYPSDEPLKNNNDQSERKPDTDENLQPPIASPSNASEKSVEQQFEDATESLAKTSTTSLGNAEHKEGNDIQKNNKDETTTIDKTPNSAEQKKKDVDKKIDEATEDEVLPTPPLKNTEKHVQTPYDCSDEFYLDLLQRDAFLTFRFLCRLSVKNEKAAISAPKQQETIDDLSQMCVRSRTLSLEMILSLLTNCNTAFQTSDLFLTLVRQAVCLSISKNGLLTHPALFELSLSTFLILLKNFRAPLKAELEVLFNEIFLYVLDNPNATFQQKYMVLQALYKICATPQTLIDIYLNYDCDFNMASIYEHIVSILAKLAKGSEKTTAPTSKTSSIFAISEESLSDPLLLQERKLRVKSIRCLVGIATSLSEWVREATSGSGTSAMATVTEMMTKLEEKGASTSDKDKVDKQESSSAEVSPTDSNRSRFSDRNAPPVLVTKNPLRNVSLRDQPFPVGQNDGSDLATATDHPDEFEKMKNKKNIMKQGIALFNTKPNKGIAFLKENGLLTDDESVVDFIQSNTELNKSAIGDFIGEGGEDNIRYMRLFLDKFDFSSLGFVKALRKFLQTFRLPGEAQKIDRIMEKFAAVYCSQNPKVFAKADVAYTLAFSIMMLNTDLHSSRIKNKMTKNDFIKNNRGINDNSDLPDEFLGSIFDEIATNEIVLEEERTVKELEKMTSVGFSSNSRELEQQRRMLYKKETKQIEKKSATLMKRGKDRTIVPFKSATHIDHARPMFDVLWGPVMAAVSTAFEETIADDFPTTDEKRYMMAQELPVGETNYQILELCLIGFVSATKIACLFRLDTERDAFVSSLAKLTSLNHIADMKAKNIAAVKTLIYIATSYGNYLEESWRPILKCVSQMDRWQLVDDANAEVEGATSTSPVSHGGFTENFKKNVVKAFSIGGDPNDVMQKLHARRGSLEKLVKEFHTQSTIIAVDKIFANSMNLNGSSIIHFYRALCQISAEEVEISRMYLMQKIVEISAYNMGRIRLEWTQIWKVLTPHFNHVGCHSNVTMATYAVDSLRQLGMKFLERDELAHFHTQNEFLKPMEHIMRHTQFTEIRDLVVRSMFQMITSRARNIKSGWKSIFVIFARAASERDDLGLVQRSFKMVQAVLTDYWEMIDGSFVDYVNCIVDFAFLPEKPESEALDGIAESAVSLLVECASRLAQDVIRASSPTSSERIKIDEESFYLTWFPLLSGLARIALDSSVTFIRTKSLDCLFDILKRHGQLFSFKDNHWRTVFKSVLPPMFEDLKDPELRPDKSFSEEEETGFQAQNFRDSVNGAIWVQALRRMIETIGFFLVEHNMSYGSESFMSQPDLVESVLDLIGLLISRNSDNLAQTGVIYLQQFIQQNYKVFNYTLWNVVTCAVEKAFRSTISVELLRYPITVGSKSPKTDVEAEHEANLIASIDVDHAQMKCVVHAMVLQFMRELCLEADDDSLAIINGTSSSLLSTGTNALPVLGVQSNLHVRRSPSVFCLAIPVSLRPRWLACLHASYSFANAFNNNYDLRLALWRSGATPQMPHLIKQETQSIATYISILCHLYREYGDDIPAPPENETSASDPVAILQDAQIPYSCTSEILQPAVEESQQILTRFTRLLVEPGKYQREITGWIPVIILIFREILAISWGGALSPSSPVKVQQFKQHISTFFRLAIRLIVVEKSEVRVVLQEFMERIAVVVENDSFVQRM